MDTVIWFSLTDFDKFFSHRALWLFFRFDANQGLAGLKPAMKWTSDDWSIYSAQWITDAVLIIKAYSDNHTEEEYRYFQTSMPS